MLIQNITDSSDPELRDSYLISQEFPLAEKKE